MWEKYDKLPNDYLLCVNLLPKKYNLMNMYIHAYLCESCKKIRMKSAKEIYIDCHSWLVVQETCIEVTKTESD